MPGGLENGSRMKKTKAKQKAAPKEAGANATRGKVVKLKPKPKRPLSSKLPPVTRYWSSTKQFVVEAIQELKKVTWPNRKETLGTTGVVLVLVILIAIFLGLVDLGLARLVHYVVH
jgi:preprotein translocase subunit SecE